MYWCNAEVLKFVVEPKVKKEGKYEGVENANEWAHSRHAIARAT
jgi:hypothetical protein